MVAIVTSTRSEPILILWDIDHTLITAGAVGREIYARAFEEVVGQPLRKFADMSGRTDRAIFRHTLALHGVTDFGSGFENFYAALAKVADEHREQMRAAGRRMPGAEEAIRALADHDVVQTVATGNIKPIAVTKLETFRLATHIDFDVGGYGAQCDTRPPLIRQAWQRAQDKYGREFPAHRVVVIGDTPFDVSGAREVGVHAIGVATGGSTVQELSAVQADIVLADLSDTESVVRAIHRAVHGPVDRRRAPGAGTVRARERDGGMRAPRTS